MTVTPTPILLRRPSFSPKKDVATAPRNAPTAQEIRFIRLRILENILKDRLTVVDRGYGAYHRLAWLIKRAVESIAIDCGKFLSRMSHLARMNAGGRTQACI